MIVLFSPVYLLFVVCVRFAYGQTEGDIGYEYNGNYEEDYDEEEIERGFEPVFDVLVVNVTVVAGQTAVLPCSIDYLNKHKVAWLKHNAVPLTFDTDRIIDDTRFAIVRQDPRQWNLEIREVRSQDHGEYRCTVNTNPVKMKTVKLHVKVPATVSVEHSTGDVTVVEGETVTLVCNVSGMPTPDITWYRRPALGKTVQRQMLDTVGPVLIIVNATRSVDDIYECVASNGVRPAASHQMRLTVHFPPEIILPNRRLGQSLGRETILECIISASQPVSYYWEKDGHKFLTVPTDRHRLEAFDDGDHELVLSLRISDLQRSDYGQYDCHASNRLGTVRKSMQLYEYVELESKPPTKAPAADIATASTRPETSGVLVRRVGTTVPQTTIRQKKRPSTEHNIARPQTATTALIHVKLGAVEERKSVQSRGTTSGDGTMAYLSTFCLTVTAVTVQMTNLWWWLSLNE